MNTPNANQMKDAVRTNSEAINETLSSIQGFSIVLWTDPRKSLPEEGSYLMVKERDLELGIVCSEAAFEHGAFWYIVPSSAKPIPPQNILAWAYMPYDERVQGQD